MLYNKNRGINAKNRRISISNFKDTKIPQSAFSRWKKGESNPSLKILKILSEYFGVPIGYFTDGVEGAPKVKKARKFY